jgi:hypothetical protein
VWRGVRDPQVEEVDHVDVEVEQELVARCAQPRQSLLGVNMDSLGCRPRWSKCVAGVGPTTTRLPPLRRGPASFWIAWIA